MKLFKNIKTAIIVSGLAAILGGCQDRRQEPDYIVSKDCRTLGGGWSKGPSPYEVLEQVGEDKVVPGGGTSGKYNAWGHLVVYTKSTHEYFIAETWDYDSRDGLITRHRKCINGELVLDEELRGRGTF